MSVEMRWTGELCQFHQQFLLSFVGQFDDIKEQEDASQKRTKLGPKPSLLFNYSLPNVLKREAGLFTGLIGKKHIGPPKNYKFNFEHSEEQESILQTGRNITHIKLLTRKFFEKCKRKSKVKIY